MAKKIYGADPSQPLTPLMVRDAIIECFIEAHCVDKDVSVADKEASEEYCQKIVYKAFADSEGNFEDPSKDDLIGAMRNLAKFSKNFRDPSLVEKHYQEIMILVNKLK
jgi:hypothetical protein